MRDSTDNDDITAVARKMRAHYGRQAVALMESRARNHLRHDEIDGATFWQQVAEAVRRLNADGAPTGGPAVTDRARDA